MIRVLVAEDDALMRSMLAEGHAARAHGFRLLFARDGSEALARLLRGEADALLTDLRMPGMDGFALLDAVRARPDIAALPVWMFTSRPHADDRAAAARRGVPLLEKRPRRAAIAALLALLEAALPGGAP